VGGLETRHASRAKKHADDGNFREHLRSAHRCTSLASCPRIVFVFTCSYLRYSLGSRILNLGLKRTRSRRDQRQPSVSAQEPAARMFGGGFDPKGSTTRPRSPKARHSPSVHLWRRRSEILQRVSSLAQSQPSRHRKQSAGQPSQRGVWTLRTAVRSAARPASARVALKFFCAATDMGQQTFDRAVRLGSSAEPDRPKVAAQVNLGDSDFP
jgi:hypothetical protein